MSYTEFPSRLLENAVNEFASLPGVGRKTAFRLVMNLLRRDAEDVRRFGESIIRLHGEIHYCRLCHNISDTEVCNICNDDKRDKSIICVVENIQDVMAIENTRQFRGVYHVLGGIISPIDGIGPADLKIESLEEKVKEGGINEVIFALSTTMEGDTTNFYLYKKLSRYNISLTTLARGVAVGDELEYTDEITLGRAINNRNPYQQ
ncbi:MAG: recombination protein RecR [Bacteroidetes bacterium GWE2_41_25]|nr:MAG: recombination protein RecR [Bacteroidetes bacterium GWA2_40_15]OFX89735.1 MAG: recombination protein RecR [Bacteroidetes bacterium GWC2_40_22]OFY00637.1 MAG: recombination protein RecR [Bacteroidetes bacterium GWE2_41_25]HBH84114.1 recombination protein RecR [Bacteroidales bacterium]HBQ81945.1 recombination protein RecR [Bacteroidales bacterium]